LKALAAVVATALALGVLGCGGGGDDEQPIEVRRAPKLVTKTAIEGGSGRERALLGRAVEGMERTTLKRIAFAPEEARREGDDGPVVAIAFTPVRGASVRRQWEEWIVAGAFSRRLLAAGLPAEVDGSDRDGSFTARPRLDDQPDPRPLSDAREEEVLDGIREAADRSGGDLVRLEVHRPYGVAVALSLTAKNPPRFLKRKVRSLLRELDAHRERLEGIYLAVLDPSRRRLVLEWGSWTRNPAGSYWVRRDLAKCSPIQQSEPPGAEEPPDCPA
jgi:hypothetical protein